MKADETHLQLAADAVEETMQRFTANGIDRGALSWPALLHAEMTYWPKAEVRMAARP
jgi:hypothetical protein